MGAPPVNAEPNLVGYWNFDNCDATDSSGYNNNGAINGNPTCVQGQVGNGMQFDGVDDFIEVPNSSSLNPSEMTISAWFSPSSYTSSSDNNGHHIIVNKEDQYEVAILADRYLGVTGSDYVEKGELTYAFNADMTPTWLWQKSNYYPPIDNFTHVAVTFDSTNVGTVFINGVETSNFQYLQELLPTENVLRIGARLKQLGAANYAHFNGIIDEVKIFNLSLGAQEIQQLYKQALNQNDFVSISGQVIDASTSHGISGAVVSTSLDSSTVTTDPNGYFDLTIQTEENYSTTLYTINVSAEGYDTFSSEGAWGDHPENQTFYLTPTIIIPEGSPYVISEPSVGDVSDGTILVQNGYDFSPGGDVTLHFTDPSGLHTTIDKIADVSGSFEHQYKAHSDSAVGQWEYYAVDKNTGLQTETIFINILASQSFTLPDTGQTLCYHTTTEIDCAGTGQDGEFNINSLSYTNNGDGTVTDNVTGFIWQQSDDGVPRAWQGAIDYCSELTLGGSSNWRLPNIKELTRIVDYGRSDPAIDPIFTVASAFSGYWTIDLYAGSEENAWAVTSRVGRVQNYSKDIKYFARCVSDE